MFFWNFLAFYDPTDVGNLISGSSAFSKSSLNIWKFTVHILWRLAWRILSITLLVWWEECNCAVVWTFFGIAFFGFGMKTDLFKSCGHCWVFQICWHIECSTFTALSFRIWNISTVISSPPLGLFIVMFHKAHLTSHSRVSGSRLVITIVLGCYYLLRFKNSFVTR